MELKAFVKQVLIDVIEGVEEVRSSSARDVEITGSTDSRSIEFDVAVTVEDKIEGKAQAGISVLSALKANGDVSTGVRNETVSRIRFGVHVHQKSKRAMENHDAGLRADGE